MQLKAIDFSVPPWLFIDTSWVGWSVGVHCEGRESTIYMKRWGSMIGYAHQAKGNREHSTVYLYGQEPSTLLIAGLWFLLLISAMGSCSYISNSHSSFLDYMVYYSKKLFETITWHVVWKQDTEMAAAGLWAGWGWFRPCRLRTMSGWNNPALQT